jgi:uncharacterized protein YeaO (DUF488 family)
MLQIKRVYDDPVETDGYRVLVDRLWPRGVSREKAALDLWLKDIAPSPDLRTWFGHEPAKFKEFSARYTEELGTNPAVAELKKLLGENPQVTLLYAAHDPECNHALVLRDYVEANFGG